MPRPKRDQSSEKGGQGEPLLPPPRKNQPLLAVAGTLVILWIVFLLYLALAA